MRGKHGNAAKNRRDRAELEQRAETAEHRAERAEKELAKVKESLARQLVALQNENRQLAEDRDNATSPALQAEHARALRLMTDLGEAKRTTRFIQDAYERTAMTVDEVLEAAGYPAEHRLRVLEALRRFLKNEALAVNLAEHRSQSIAARTWRP
ncbi:hypothetical protein ACFY8K_16975 [Streptomyces misionensis]|uniref:hypothetical protein n=1 Tax=Streptomyces misionensis TaxID=67331 RepID=UPI003674CADB